MAELESTVVRLCLVATRGITEDLLERLAHELRRDLPALLPTVTWQVSTQPELEIGPPVPLGELVDRARAELLARGCHLLLLVTDLPLMIGRKPVLSHVTRAQGVAVVSFPAHGAVSPHNRAVKTLRAAAAALIGVDPVGDLSRGRRRRATARMRELGRGVAYDQGAVAFVARVITGNLLLLAGMIRANQPWRLTLHLSKALTAALTAGVFALVTTDIWRLADDLGTARLAFACPPVPPSLRPCIHAGIPGASDAPAPRRGDAVGGPELEPDHERCGMSLEPAVELRRVTMLSIALGLLLVIGGVIGLVYIVVATITSAILFAWLLIFGGGLALVDAWQRRGKDGFWASAVTGVVNLAAGAIILWKPAESLVALTMVVAVFLLIGGLFRIVTGLAGGVPGSGWVSLHGVVDVFLAVLILANLPEASFYVLGVMLSVSLLVDGLALIVLGTVAHRGLGRITTFARVQEVPGAPRHAS